MTCRRIELGSKLEQAGSRIWGDVIPSHGPSIHLMLSSHSAPLGLLGDHTSKGCALWRWRLASPSQ